jgi:hypothetical protein
MWDTGPSSADLGLPVLEWKHHNGWGRQQESDHILYDAPAGYPQQIPCCSIDKAPGAWSTLPLYAVLGAVSELSFHTCFHSKLAQTHNCQHDSENNEHG